MPLLARARHGLALLRPAAAATAVAACLATTAQALPATAAGALLPVSLPVASGSAGAPVTPASLPAQAEPLAAYVPANSCDPTAKPGTVAVGDLLKATYAGSSYGISRTCGTDPLPTSEHYDGRAVDFFRNVRDTTQKAQIDALIKWLFATDSHGTTYANARRLGVMYLIWNNRIWGSYRSSEGWRPYSSCASHPESSYDTTCHRDHIHISLSWEGAMKRTSFWTGQVAARDYGPCRVSGLNWAAPYTVARATACPSYPHVAAPSGASSLNRTLTTYSGMRLAVGSTGPVVTAVQTAVGASADGRFGALTKAALISWQQAHGLAGTGVTNYPTWRALLQATGPAPVKTTTTTPAPAPSTAPTTSPATGTGSTGSTGSTATTTTTTPKPAPTPKAATAPVAKAPVSPLTQYLHTLLRRGSRGPAVRAVQRRLSLQVDGWFGPQTQTAVRRFQRRHHLPITGRVGYRTWKALGA